MSPSFVLLVTCSPRFQSVTPVAPVCPTGPQPESLKGPHPDMWASVRARIQALRLSGKSLRKQMHAVR